MPGLGLHEGTGGAAGTRLCGFDRDDVELCGGGLALRANGEIKTVNRSLHSAGSRCSTIRKVFHGLPANQVLLDDPFQGRGIALAIPRALWVHHGDRPPFADTQAVRLGAQDAALVGQAELMKAFLEEVPRCDAPLFVTAFRLGLIGAQEDLAAGNRDPDSGGDFLLRFGHWGGCGSLVFGGLWSLVVFVFGLWSLVFGCVGVERASLWPKTKDQRPRPIGVSPAPFCRAGFRALVAPMSATYGWSQTPLKSGLPLARRGAAPVGGAQRCPGTED